MIDCRIKTISREKTGFVAKVEFFNDADGAVLIEKNIIATDREVFKSHLREVWGKVEERFGQQVTVKDFAEAVISELRSERSSS